MNELDQGLFEAELRRLKPATPPTELMDRLAEAGPGREAQSSERGGTALPFASWRRLLRWWAPALGAAAVLALCVWRLPEFRRQLHGATALASPSPPARPEDVEAGRNPAPVTLEVASSPGGSHGGDKFWPELAIPGLETVRMGTFYDLARVSYEISDPDPGRSSADVGLSIRPSLPMEPDRPSEGHSIGGSGGQGGSRRLRFNVGYSREL